MKTRTMAFLIATLPAHRNHDGHHHVDIALDIYESLWIHEQHNPNMFYERSLNFGHFKLSCTHCGDEQSLELILWGKASTCNFVPV